MDFFDAARPDLQASADAAHEEDADTYQRYIKDKHQREAAADPGGWTRPGAQLPKLAMIVPRFPSIRGIHDTTEALRRLGVFQGAVEKLPALARTAFVRDPPPTSGHLHIDHWVAETARLITSGAGVSAPEWTRAPTLTYYRHGSLPFCSECLGAGAVLHKNGRKLVPCAPCEATGMLLGTDQSKGLRRVLQARGALRSKAPYLEMDRELLAQIRLNGEMGLSPEELVNRYGSPGRDPTPQEMLDRLRQARVELDARVGEKDAQLAAEMTKAREELARSEPEYVQAQDGFLRLHWDNPGQGPLDPYWVTRQRRWEAAQSARVNVLSRIQYFSSAIDKHRRWAALVRERDADTRQKLEHKVTGF